jgi:DNA-binding SARP family transcriptional activator
MSVKLNILGPLSLQVDGAIIDLGTPKLQAFLALLARQPNRVVPAEVITDELWPDKPPSNPRATLHTYVSRLRRQLASALTDMQIKSTPSGYTLQVDPMTVDAERFTRLTAEARQASQRGSLTDAQQLLQQALDLWRGRALDGVRTGTRLNSYAIQLEDQKLDAVESRIDIALRLGQHELVIHELRELVSEHPLSERLHGQLIVALYRSGRTADALDAYRQFRQTISSELGMEPSPSLQQLQQSILQGNPSLDLTVPPRGGAADAGRQVVSSLLPADIGDFTGRQDELTLQPWAPRGLPPDVHPFTGRERETTELQRLLAEGLAEGNANTVLITAVSGAAGMGKTALAVHAAHQLADHFPDGQLYVNLRGFDPTGEPLSPVTAIRGFLIAFGVPPNAIPTELDGLTAMYRSLAAGKRMLIVLDNASSSEQVIPILPASPSCTVMITSRHRLVSLTARHGAHQLVLDVLPERDARDLLAHYVGLERMAAEPDAVADLLGMCAGLPLAVRIVAARAEHNPTFPLAVLADELRDATALLDGLDAGDQWVNLRTVLSWSVRALSPQAAGVFGLLGVAPGVDIGLPAAASLTGQPTGQTRTILRELENASLVQQHMPGRYRMHDLIRAYATDFAAVDLAEHVREAALRRVIDFYTHTAHTADRLLSPYRPPIEFDPPAPGTHPEPLPDVPKAMAWLDSEHAALLAAQHAAASHTWHRAVWQLAWAMDTLHLRRGHRHDRLAVWRAALDAATHLPDPKTRMLAHRLLGDAYVTLGHHEESIEHLHQALTLAEQHHDTDQQAHTDRALAWAWEQRGDYRRALEHATRALDLYRALDQPVGEATALNALGWYAARLGEYDTARTHSQAALILHRHHHNAEGEAETLDSLGYIAHSNGHYRQATDYYQQALTLFRTLGNTYEAANTLNALGHPHVALGEHEQARVAWREALELFQDQGRDTDTVRIQQQLAKLDDNVGVGIEE